MSFRSPAITAIMQQLVAEGKLALADVQLVSPAISEADLRENQVVDSEVDWGEYLSRMGSDTTTDRFHPPSHN
jgi:hypothetical protein